MANLPNVNEYPSGIYQLETSDPVLGGAEGIANLQAKQLSNRTTWLRAQLLDLQNNGFNGRKVRRNNLVHGVLPTSVRNAVLSGPVDSEGTPNMVQPTIGTKNVLVNGSPEGIRMSFAAGYDDYGQIDYPGKITTDTTYNINTGLGIPNTSQEVTLYARHTPTDEGGSTTVEAILTANIYYTPTPPTATTGLWWNPVLRIFLAYSSDFGSWSLPRYIVPLARLFRDSSGNITGFRQANYREGIDGVSNVPIGTIITSAVDVAQAPQGFLLCNGASLPKAQYIDLFNAIFYRFGGTGANFNIPDLRGEFLRGADNGRDVDPGRNLGTAQAAKVGDHKHETPISLMSGGDMRMISSMPFGTGGSFTSTHVNGGGSPLSGTFSYALTNDPFASSNTGVGDNRPRNVAVNFYIKAF